MVLGLRRASFGGAMVFLGILSLNMLAFQIADVVATAGFLKAMGTHNLLWLWAATLVVSLITTTIIGGLSDRVPRRKMLIMLMGGAIALNGLVGALKVAGVADGAVYGLLYFVADQQYFLIPMIFWILANDVIASAERKRAFPVIASGSVVAQIAGNAVVYGVSLTGRGIGGSPLFGLLALNALSLGVGGWLAARRVRQDGSLSGESLALIQSVVVTTKMVSDYWKNLPIVRYLAFSTFLMEFVLLVIQYHFLQVVNHHFGLNSLVRVLSLFTTATVGVTTGLQWFVSGRLLERVGLKQAFFAMPVAGILAGLLSVLGLGLVGSGSGQFLLQVVRWAWDHPSHAAFQGLLPEQRRGRITAFADSYVSTLGSLLGCLVLWLAGAQGVTLSLAVGASIIAMWAAWRMRSTYDSSLLNWRMGRPKRRSVLDQLDL